MGVAFSIFVTIIIAGFLWFYIVRPILEDYEVIGPRVVSYSQIDNHVMSRENEQTTRTVQTDGTDEYVSEADQWMDRLEVDRTKTTIIEILVYSGWTVEQIRSKLKGDNGVLGTEIEAARKRLDIELDPPRMLRVNDNGSGERLIPMEIK